MQGSCFLFSLALGHFASSLLTHLHFENPSYHLQDYSTEKQKVGDHSFKVNDFPSQLSFGGSYLSSLLVIATTIGCLSAAASAKHAKSYLCVANAFKGIVHGVQRDFDGFCFQQNGGTAQPLTSYLRCKCVLELQGDRTRQV